MGNEANCKNFCENNEQFKVQPSQLKMAEYPLECTICNKEVQHINFNKHLDICHYANIQQRDDIIAVICLLCDNISDKLENHQRHLSEKHPYTNLVDQRDQEKEIVTNKFIKSKLKQADGMARLKSLDKSKVQNGLIEYQDQSYMAEIRQKQYDGMEYDEIQVFSELVLFPIFSLYRTEAKFYTIQKTALQRTIQCKAYIICDKK